MHSGQSCLCAEECGWSIYKRILTSDVLTEKGKKLFEKSKVKADEVAAKAKEVGVQIKNAASEHAKVVVHNLAEAGYPIKGIDREAAAAKEGDGALEVAKKIAEKVENCKSSECYSKGIDDGITDSGKNLEEVKKACKE